MLSVIRWVTEMARARQIDPAITQADKPAGRVKRVVKRNGKPAAHAVATDETLRAQRLARGKAAIEAVLSGASQSVDDQVEQPKVKAAVKLGRAAKISDEQIVELLFENLPISAEQAIERLAQFDAGAMRRLLKSR